MSASNENLQNPKQESKAWVFEDDQSRGKLKHVIQIKNVLNRDESINELLNLKTTKHYAY